MEAGINGLEHALLTPYNDFAPDDQRTGPDEIMLSPGFWPKVYQGWLQADLSSDKAKRWYELLVTRDVSLCPTLTVNPGTGDEPTADELRYAPRVAERWLEATLQRETAEVPQEFRQFALRVRAKLQEFVVRVREAGGRIIAGTDTGAIRSLVPGFSLHRELALLSGAGLSNMDVLCAATSQAAEALRRDDIGTIAPGKRADVLLVRQDPLEKIAALRELDGVIADGIVYDPQALLQQAGG
jgi:hypothetical protein